MNSLMTRFGMLIIGTLFLGIASNLAAADAPTASQCPAKIILKGARFINNEQFPTEAQIRTNFNQVLHAPFEPDFPTWMPSDLDSAELIVSTLQSNYKQDEVVLEPKWTGQSCTGSIGKLTYSADFTGVEFAIDDRVYVDIGARNHAPVQLLLALASNCSNCVNTTELFEFLSVTAER